MRYLYDRLEASFKDLLLAAMWAKVESRNHHLTKVKAVTMIEPDRENEASGIGLNDLNEQLKSLGQYLKSATFTAKTKSSWDLRNQSQGPGPSAADLSEIAYPYSVTNVTVGGIIRGNVPTGRR